MPLEVALHCKLIPVAPEFESFDVINWLVSTLKANHVEVMQAGCLGRVAAEAQTLFVTAIGGTSNFWPRLQRESVRALGKWMSLMLLGTSSKCSFYVTLLW